MEGNAHAIPPRTPCFYPGGGVRTSGLTAQRMIRSARANRCRGFERVALASILAMRRIRAAVGKGANDVGQTDGAGRRTHSADRIARPKASVSLQPALIQPLAVKRPYHLLNQSNSSSSLAWRRTTQQQVRIGDAMESEAVHMHSGVDFRTDPQRRAATVG